MARFAIAPFLAVTLVAGWQPAFAREPEPDEPAEVKIPDVGTVSADTTEMRLGTGEVLTVSHVNSPTPCNLYNPHLAAAPAAYHLA